MTKLQKQAYVVMAKKLDRDSKYYDEDLQALNEHWSTRSPEQCKETLARNNYLESWEPTEEELGRFCIFDGLL